MFMHRSRSLSLFVFVFVFVLMWSSPCRAFLGPLSQRILSSNSGPASIVQSKSSNNNTQRRMIGSILDLLGGGGSLIDPKDALPGRQSPVLGNLDTLRHYVLGNKITQVPKGHKVAVYGSGCFWGSEKGQWRFPKGIHSTAVGYCAGFTPNPTYEEACSGRTGHTEGVRVVYNPQEVSLVDILRWFWESHDPTSGMGQGNDRGTQYRSGFYYDDNTNDDNDRKIIEASKQAYEKALNKPITTEIAPASDYETYGGLWYYAEEYHQQYLAKPGARPYCSAQPQGVSLPPYEDWCPFPEGSAEREYYQPTLPESFWKLHGPKKGCSVVQQGNEPIAPGSFAK